jgi:hypothetical protein
VIMPFPGDVTRAGHAVCLVDYEDLEGEPELGGGRFICATAGTVTGELIVHIVLAMVPSLTRT